MSEQQASVRPGPGSVENPVLAAGVVLWSGTPEEPRFLLLRNALHGTWGFAKGHLEPGEDLRAGALREVAEETGYTLAEADLLPGFADTHAYRPSGRAWKRVVHFLAAAAVEPSALRDSDEHDAHDWLDADAALDRLEHEDLKRTLVRAAAALGRRASR